jgi:hypothetical protein
VSASPAALALASAAVGDPARIHSVFRTAVNVETSAGLLTLATAETGGLPNGILLETSDLRGLQLRPGMALASSAVGLAVPSAGVIIDLSDAALWSPRFAHRKEHPTAIGARWRARSPAAWQLARTSAPRGGLRPLLWPDAHPAHGHGWREDAGPWIPRARASIDALTDAIARTDQASAVLAAGDLIGLGDGGTPSGDDALVGVEAVLHATGDPLAGFLGEALDGIGERTTVVAAAFLWHAALGEFSERLHELVGALLDPGDDALAPAIARAAGWGATSGADGMLGVLRTLDAIAQRTVASRKSA